LKNNSLSFSSSFITSVIQKPANENQHILLPEQNKEVTSEKKTENDGFDDDTSKLTFKEKMILFNKKKSIGLTPTSSLRNNRNRLTQVKEWFIDDC
jgi:hypothetical protein